MTIQDINWANALIATTGLCETDTVSEYTAAAGVTADSVLMKDGAITLPLGTITAALANLTATATWNNAGVTFTAIDLDVTDTASAAASILLNLRVGTVSKFSVNKAGLLTVSSISTPSLTVTSTATFVGATIANLGTVTTADINGGTIDGTTIGASVASSVKGTTVQATTKFYGTAIDTAAASDLVLQYNGGARLTIGNSTVKLAGGIALVGGVTTATFVIKNTGQVGTTSLMGGTTSGTDPLYMLYGSSHASRPGRAAAWAAEHLWYAANGSTLFATVDTAGLSTASGRSITAGNSAASVQVACGTRTRMHYDQTTGEWGLQVKLINKTGGNSVKGNIVNASTGTDMAYMQAGASSDEPIGVVYEAGVADGSYAWVWTGQGSVCQVLLKDGTASTRGYWVETSNTAGRADATNSNPVPETHWQEIGHCLESKTAGTNVLARILFHTL